jgi:hypothetical protein
MKRNITRLGGLMILALTSLPLMGQIERTVIVREAPGAELRAGETVWWPDSVVTYTGTGEKKYKEVYDEASRQGTFYNWENNAWVTTNNWESQGYRILFFSPAYINEGETGVFSYDMVANWTGWIRFSLPDGSKTSTVNDANGNLTSVIIKDSDGRNYYTFSIRYNDKNNPVSIEWNWYDSPVWRANYQYNADGYAVLFESFYYNNAWINERRVTLKFDTQDRPDLIEVYKGENNKWVLDEYTRFYYGTSSGNESVSAVSPSVYTANHTLYIEIAQAEMITVYSLNGQKLWERQVQPGATTLNTSRFPQGVLIVRGGSGWTKKIKN